VAGLSLLRRFYLLHFSKPASDRLIYRELRRRPPAGVPRARKIVEIGMGTAQRAVHAVNVLKGFHAAGDIHYTGIDQFEARIIGDGPRLTLRDAHRLLKATGARVQLVPGAAGEALSRVANGLKEIDAVILSADQTHEQMVQAWFYMPRMVHDSTLFFQETTSPDGATTMHLLTRDEIAAMTVQGRRRAA
jgi:hypothetical protein